MILYLGWLLERMKGARSEVKQEKAAVITEGARSLGPNHGSCNSPCVGVWVMALKKTSKRKYKEVNGVYVAMA